MRASREQRFVKYTMVHDVSLFVLIEVCNSRNMNIFKHSSRYRSKYIGFSYRYIHAIHSQFFVYFIYKQIHVTYLARERAR